MIYRVVVLGFRGEQMMVDLGTEEPFHTMTVKQLKEKIAETFWPSEPEMSAYTTLFYDSKGLERESDLLHEHGITQMSTIVTFIRVPGEGPLKWKEDEGMGDEEGETPNSMESIYLKIFQQIFNNTLGSNPSFH